MAESDRPRSPFAAMADLSAQRPVRVRSADEIEQMLASHQLYLKTEYREGHRADFSSAMSVFGAGIQKNRCRTTIAERMVKTLAELLFIGDQVVCLSHD